MIYFITDREHKVIPDENLKIIHPNFFYEDENFPTNLMIQGDIGFDTEDNGLDAYTSQPLLVIFSNEKTQLVIDWTCRQLIIDLFDLYKDKLFIGHNLKYDYKMIKVFYGIGLEKMYDTMIAEQRLYQGVDHSNALVALTTRYLGILPEGMDKNVRSEFIGVDPNTFQFQNKHIVYAANDTVPLFEIKRKQEVLIDKAKQRFLIYDIEFPLIRVLAEAELEGWILNTKKWLELNEKQKELKFKYENDLDAELRRLRDNLPKEKAQYLRNGKFDRKRNKEVEIGATLDLFGEESLPTIGKGRTAKKVVNPYKTTYINYGSSGELIYILGRLGEPVPTKSGQYIVPTFKKAKNGKDIVEKSNDGFTTGAGAIENYLAENPTSRIKTFIETLVSFRESTTRINTFGKGFIRKYTNAVTNRVHTIFRQCAAITGRLQSGNVSEGYYNSQNIPGEADYRECFMVEEGYGCISSDYSGCEAVVMIDKARDEKFYEFAIKNDDAHSPLAQAVWRAIGTSRNDPKLANIVISKKENKHLRNDFKPMTFGVCYGMGIKKAAKTLRIKEEEAKIGIRVQKSMLPKTFKYLDMVAKQALAQGFIVINQRTNSRVWYPKVIEARKNKFDLLFQDIHEIESSARNITIQGTNADIVKEAMVELDREFRTRKLDAKVIGTVHDEIIVKYHLSIKAIDVIVNNDQQILSMGEFVKYIMETVANRYLSFIEMKAEYKSMLTWTK